MAIDMIIAEKFGISPEVIPDWSSSLYDGICVRMSAKNEAIKNKQEIEDRKRKIEQTRARNKRR